MSRDGRPLAERHDSGAIGKHAEFGDAREEEHILDPEDWERAFLHQTA